MANVNIKSEKIRPSEEFITQARLFDSLLHEFLLVFHKSCVIRVHQLVSYVNQEVCLTLYRRMRQMDKDGKKLVAEFVYRHAL